MVGCLLMLVLVVVLIGLAIAGIVASVTAKPARRVSHFTPRVAVSPADRRTAVCKRSQGDLTAGSLSSGQMRPVGVGAVFSGRAARITDL
jgi:hypothetical protein